MVSFPSTDSSDENVNEFLEEAIEDEMVDYAHEFNDSSMALRDYVAGLRQAKKNMTNEVYGLRQSLGHKRLLIESLEYEVTRLKQRNKEVDEYQRLNAFVWGLVIGILLVLFVMYY